MRMILASTSPRRKALLALLGAPFEVHPPECDEAVTPDRSVGDSAALLSRSKALSVSKNVPEAIVLGSDTLIELDGAAVGKPSDIDAARSMLRKLAGRAHFVHTAVTVVRPASGIEVTQLCTARVSMKPYDETRHEQYLATGDSMGKAGGYSIQGAGHVLIERVDGDYTTVVGLPLRTTAALLVRAGMAIPIDVDRLYQAKPFENWRSFQ